MQCGCVMYMWHSYVSPYVHMLGSLWKLDSPALWSFPLPAFLDLSMCLSLSVNTLSEFPCLSHDPLSPWNFCWLFKYWHNCRNEGIVSFNDYASFSVISLFPLTLNIICLLAHLLTLQVTIILSKTALLICNIMNSCDSFLASHKVGWKGGILFLRILNSWSQSNI